jgi:type IV secretory pathway VirJ component
MIWKILFAAGIAFCWSACTAAASGDVSYGRFGEVHLYQSRAEARDVVLFFSGDDGWNANTNTLAQHLADKGAIVAGIDVRHYLAQLEKSHEACVSPSVDLENLSRFLQAKLNLKRYIQPTLVGYGSGATLAYAALGQAPEGLLKGALSIGFCPDLELKKPLCKGMDIEANAGASASTSKNSTVLPNKSLPGKWLVLQGDADLQCPIASTRRFVAAVPRGEIVALPKVDHAYSVDDKLLSKFEAAYERLAASPAARPGETVSPVAGLPLIEVRPPAAAMPSPWFAVFLSGDGGWVGLDRGVSRELAAHGISVVGWDSLKYFWSARTPDGIAQDLDRVLLHYSHEWGKTRILLVGYSQGADTMPFMVNRLPAPTRAMVGLTALIGLSDNAVFEFHVSNWLGNARGGLPTGPELTHWSGSPYLCIYGEHDRDAACDRLTGKGGEAIKMTGGHHFGGSYAEIAEEILKRLPK